VRTDLVLSLSTQRAKVNRDSDFVLRAQPQTAPSLRSHAHIKHDIRYCPSQRAKATRRRLWWKMQKAKPFANELKIFAAGACGYFE
jgi:hypothetical protein